MDDAPGAHEQARELHLRAAKLHADAARFWEARGYRALARAERERSDGELDAAQAESKSCPGSHLADAV